MMMMIMIAMSITNISTVMWNSGINWSDRIRCWNFSLFIFMFNYKMHTCTFIYYAYFVW